MMARVCSAGGEPRPVPATAANSRLISCSPFMLQSSYGPFQSFRKQHEWCTTWIVICIQRSYKYIRSCAGHGN